MKKKLIALFLVMAMTVSVTGCGDKKAENGNGEDAKEVTFSADAPSKIKIDKYVTLCDLDALEITAPVLTYSDDDLKSDMNEQFDYYVSQYDGYAYELIKDRDDVQNGDFCNIDYLGEKDGVAFDGGTAEGYNLEIGSGNFIEGFEEGLIGHKVGETVDLNLTFPETYGSEELAGQDVVFHVTINKIQTRDMPDLTDEVLKGMDCGYESVKEFEDAVRENLQAECDETVESEKLDLIWDAIADASDVKEPPKDMVTYYREELEHTLTQYADQTGLSLEDFIANYMGVSADEYEQQMADGAMRSATQDLLVQAIAKAAKIDVSNDDLKKFIEDDYANYGYESADDMMKDIGEYSYKMYRLNMQVEEYLLANIKIVNGEEKNVREYVAEKEAAAEAEETGSEE